MDASSEARVPGGSRCVDERGEDVEQIEGLRDGIEGSVSMAGGAVYIVDFEPVDVQDRMEGTEGTGETDPNGVGDVEWFKASLKSKETVSVQDSLRFAVLETNQSAATHLTRSRAFSAPSLSRPSE